VGNHTISAVERDTGIGRDTLRVWERRYGFPVPERGARGDRIYSDSQVRRLQLIKRLMDQGLRPGKIVGLDEEALDKLAQTVAAGHEIKGQGVGEVLQTVRSHDVEALDTLLRSMLAQFGLRRLILDVVAPAARLVGEHWAAGKMEIFEERLFTRVTTRLLDTSSSGGRGAALHEPVVLLATLPGEPHGLGLLMVDALLRERGSATVNLGTGVPVPQLIRAVEGVRAGVVALSFSSSYPYGQIRKNLEDLRSRLSSDTAIWIGGAGTRRLKRLPNGVCKKDLEQL